LQHRATNIRFFYVITLLSIFELVPTRHQVFSRKFVQNQPQVASMMNHMFKMTRSLFFPLLTLFLCLGFSFESKASHIIGGEIYYDSLGNNQYKVTIEIYRDCFRLSMMIHV